MKMKNNTLTPYNITLTILAISMLLILSFVVFIPNQNVYAEYNDLNENTLINFNQLFDYSKLANSKITDQYYVTIPVDAGGYYSLDQKISFVAGHKYYIVGAVTGIGGLHFDSTPTHPSFRIINPYEIITAEYTDSYQFFVYGFSSGTFKSIIQIIDLTQCFGVGNEPTLEQAKDYFTAQYYAYNKGTEIPFSKSYLQGYQEGAQSVYENLTITLNTYTIGSNSQTYANNTIERGELFFDNQYSAYSFSGVIAINLLGQVEQGTNININFELTIPSIQGEPTSYAESLTLYFAYVDNNNNLVNITGINPKYKGSWVNTYKGDFALPITTSTIYCYLNYNTIGGNLLPMTAIAIKSDITFKGLDIAQFANNAYNKGASDTNAKYSPGGVLYQSIYDLGKAEGIAQGNTFVNGLDVISTTFTKVFSIFNVEILPGIPLSIFILLPLLFGLIMFVVKIAKGG